MFNKINLHENQIINIIERFHNKFSYKLSPGRKKDLILINEEDIIYINSYIKECKYCKELEEINTKCHLVIKYIILYDVDQSIVSLNILLDDYKDLL
jgi:hypothetical protein